MIVLGFSFSSHKNDDFYNSLDEVNEYTGKSIEYSGIVVEENNYSSGQRFTLKNVQLKLKDLLYNENLTYFVYPKNQIIDNIGIGGYIKKKR